MGNTQGTGVSEEERRRNIKQMDQQMNIRFGRTSKHKLTIVVRGERGTGKSMLTKLLTGGIFDEKYTPSKPGDVEKATVPWAAGAGEDVDLTLIAVTDQEKKKDNEQSKSLKIAHEEKNRYSSKAKKAKNAEEAKIYEGCNGVVIMVNPTKEWTFSYAKDILEDIPETLEVLVVANFRDSMEQWVTTKSSMQEHIAGCGRHVHFCECCLANMFGMPAVEAFLRVCLAANKIEDFKRQTERLEADIEGTLDRLVAAAAGQNYDLYPLREPTAAADLDPPPAHPPPPAGAAAAGPADPSPAKGRAPAAAEGHRVEAPADGDGVAAARGGGGGGGGEGGKSGSKSKKGAATAAEEGGRETGGKERHGKGAAGSSRDSDGRRGRDRDVDRDVGGDVDVDATAGFYSDEEPAPAPAVKEPKGEKGSKSKDKAKAAAAAAVSPGAGSGKKVKGNAMAFWEDEDIDEPSPPPAASPPAAKAAALKFGTPPGWGEAEGGAEGGKKDKSKHKKKKDDR